MCDRSYLCFSVLLQKVVLYVRCIVEQFWVCVKQCLSLVYEGR